MLTWLDLLILLVIILGILNGKKSNFFTEFFKLGGAFFATFLAIQYYLRFGDFLKTFVPYPDNVFVPKETFYYFVAYSLIAVFVYCLVSITRDGWVIILNVKFDPVIDKTLGFVLATIKLFLIVGLIFFGLTVSGNGILGRTAETSLSRFLFQGISETIYKGCHSLVLGPVETDIYPNLNK